MRKKFNTILSYDKVSVQNKMGLNSFSSRKWEILILKKLRNLNRTANKRVEFSISHPLSLLPPSLHHLHPSYTHHWAFLILKQSPLFFYQNELYILILSMGAYQHFLYLSLSTTHNLVSETPTNKHNDFIIEEILLLIFLDSLFQTTLPLITA